MIEKYPLLPFLIFAGALISTATIGLPVFAGWQKIGFIKISYKIFTLFININLYIIKFYFTNFSYKFSRKFFI